MNFYLEKKQFTRKIQCALPRAPRKEFEILWNFIDFNT